MKKKAEIKALFMKAKVRIIEAQHPNDKQYARGFHDALEFVLDEKKRSA